MESGFRFEGRIIYEHFLIVVNPHFPDATPD